MYWDRIQAEIQLAAKYRGCSKSLQKFDKKLYYVKDEIRRFLIEKFLARCKYIHALAFFKWRLLHSPKAKKSAVVSVFEGRI